MLFFQEAQEVKTKGFNKWSDMRTRTECGPESELSLWRDQQTHLSSSPFGGFSDITLRRLYLTHLIDTHTQTGYTLRSTSRYPLDFSLQFSTEKF